MTKLETVFNQFQGKIENNKFDEFRIIVRSLYNLLLNLNYCYIDNIRLRKYRGKDVVEFNITYKNISFEELMKKTRIVYNFLKKQNPYILKYILISARIPKEMIRYENSRY